MVVLGGQVLNSCQDRGLQGVGESTNHGVAIAEIPDDNEFAIEYMLAYLPEKLERLCDQISPPGSTSAV